MKCFYTASSLARSWLEGRILPDELLVFDGRRLSFRDACSENTWLGNEVGPMPLPTTGELPQRHGRFLRVIIAVFATGLLLGAIVAGVKYVADLKGKLKNQEDNLKTIGQLNDTVAKEKKALESAEQEKEMAESEKKDIQKKFNNQAMEVRRLKEEIGRLENEKKTLESEQQNIELSRKALSENNAESTKELDKIRSKVSQLEKAMQSAEAEKQATMFVTNEQALRIEELEKIVQQQDDSVRALKSENDSLQSENEVVKYERLALSDQLAEQKLQIERIKGELETVRREKLAVESSKEDLESERAVLENIIAERNEELDRVKRDVLQLKEVEQLSEAAKQSAQLKQEEQKEEIERLKGKIAVLENDKGAAEAEVQAIKGKEAEIIGRLQARLSELQKSLQEYKQRSFVVIEVLVEGAKLSGEMVQVREQTEQLTLKTPIQWAVEYGKEYGGNLISFERNGKHYYGNIDRYSVNWRGAKILEVKLKEKMELVNELEKGNKGVKVEWMGDIWQNTESDSAIDGNGQTEIWQPTKVNVCVLVEGVELSDGEVVYVKTSGIWKPFETPIILTVKAGVSYGGNEMAFERCGKIYQGKSEGFRVDAQERKTFTVNLKEVVPANIVEPAQRVSETSRIRSIQQEPYKTRLRGPGASRNRRLGEW